MVSQMLKMLLSCFIFTAAGTITWPATRVTTSRKSTMEGRKLAIGEKFKNVALLPKTISSHLRVGPIFLGEPEQLIVKRFGSVGQKGMNQMPAFLLYTDGKSVILLNFDARENLTRIVINPGPSAKGNNLPPGTHRIDTWRWDGGAVSKLPRGTWLEGNKYWRAKPGETGKWIFHKLACTALASYYNYGGYTFQMGPLVCGKNGRGAAGSLDAKSAPVM